MALPKAIIIKITIITMQLTLKNRRKETKKEKNICVYDCLYGRGGKNELRFIVSRKRTELLKEMNKLRHTHLQPNTQNHSNTNIAIALLCLLNAALI